MSDRCARITFLLALVPLVVATVILVVVIDFDFFHSNVVSVPVAAGTILALGGNIVIWRRYVRWNFIRSASTGALVLLVLGQVLLWQPLWSVRACGMEECLILDQSLASLGLWVIGCGFLWWFAALTGRSPRSTSPGKARRSPMTPNAVRLALGIALVPLLPGLYGIVNSAATDVASWSPNGPPVIWLSYSVCAIVAASAWTVLWVRGVTWTRRRVIVTVVLTVVLLASPLCVYLRDNVLGHALLRDVWEVFCCIAPLLACAAWLAGTAWTWRTDRPGALSGLSTDALAAGGPAWCPQCGYSLTGLREVRCPECGWASTVDDIVARSLARLVAVP